MFVRNADGVSPWESVQVVIESDGSIGGSQSPEAASAEEVMLRAL